MLDIRDLRMAAKETMSFSAYSREAVAAGVLCGIIASVV